MKRYVFTRNGILLYCICRSEQQARTRLTKCLVKEVGNVRDVIYYPMTFIGTKVVNRAIAQDCTVRSTRHIQYRKEKKQKRYEHKQPGQGYNL